jgi:hypothetical protein
LGRGHLKLLTILQMNGNGHLLSDLACTSNVGAASNNPGGYGYDPHCQFAGSHIRAFLLGDSSMIYSGRRDTFTVFC